MIMLSLPLNGLNSTILRVDNSTRVNARNFTASYLHMNTLNSSSFKYRNSDNLNVSYLKDLNVSYLKDISASYFHGFDVSNRSFSGLNVSSSISAGYFYSKVTRIPLLLMITWIIFFGVLGNGLMVAVLAKYYSASALRSLMLMMGVADLTCTGVAAPLRIWTLISAYSFTNSAACKLIFLLTSWSTNCSNFLVVLVAIDRLQRLTLPALPEVNRRRSRNYVLLVILLATLVTVPFAPLFGHHTVLLERYTLHMCWLDDAYVDTVYLSLYEAVLGITFVVSLTLFVTVYGLIVCSINSLKRTVAARLHLLEKEHPDITPTIQPREAKHFKLPSITSEADVSFPIYKGQRDCVLSFSTDKDVKLPRDPVSFSHPVYGSLDFSLLKLSALEQNTEFDRFADTEYDSSRYEPRPMTVALGEGLNSILFEDTLFSLDGFVPNYGVEDISLCDTSVHRHNVTMTQFQAVDIQHQSLQDGPETLNSDTNANRPPEKVQNDNRSPLFMKDTNRRQEVNTDNCRPPQVVSDKETQSQVTSSGRQPPVMAVKSKPHQSLKDDNWPPEADNNTSPPQKKDNDRSPQVMTDKRQAPLHTDTKGLLQETKSAGRSSKGIAKKNRLHQKSSERSSQGTADKNTLSQEKQSMENSPQCTAVDNRLAQVSITTSGTLKAGPPSVDVLDWSPRYVSFSSDPPEILKVDERPLESEQQPQPIKDDESVSVIQSIRRMSTALVRSLSQRRGSSTSKYLTKQLTAEMSGNLQLLMYIQNVWIKSLICMLILTSVVIVTWLPNLLARTVWGRESADLCDPFFSCLNNSASYCISSVYVGSMFNPFLYCFSNKHFRLQVNRLLFYLKAKICFIWPEVMMASCKRRHKRHRKYRRRSK